MRTCSAIAVDDCKKVNGDLVCICSRRLCNGEISDNARKMLDGGFDRSGGSVGNEEEDDNEEGDDDDDDSDGENENAESGDDAIHFAEEETTKIVDSSTNAADDEVLMSTMRPPSTNSAVTFNFKNQLKIFYVAIFLQSFVINNF
jgi:hypothetical protein